MNLSIKNTIYLSFFLLTFLFITNGVVTVLTMNHNKNIAEYIKNTTTPSLQAIDDLKDVVLESKMYTMGSFFSSTHSDPKTAFKKIYDSTYPQVKRRLLSLLGQWDNASQTDSLKAMFPPIERLLDEEDRIVLTVENEKNKSVITDEIIPNTEQVVANLNAIIASVKHARNNRYDELRGSFGILRTTVTMVSVAILCIALLLPVYLNRIIIRPIHRIRDIVNDLGRGVIQKIKVNGKNDEIGQMIASVNSLSQKLYETATFAQEIGNRHFNAPYQPLGEEDILGKALITMRDNIRLSEEKLLQSEANLRNILENTDTAYVLMNEEGRVLTYNARAQEMVKNELGKSIAEGDEFANVMPADRKKHLIEAMQQVLENRRPVIYETCYVNKDKPSTWLDVRLHPIVNEENELLGVSIAATNISEQKNAEEQIRLSNERYRLVSKATNDAIWDWNLLAQEVYWGGSYEAIFGYRHVDGVGSVHSWDSKIHPDDKERVFAGIYKVIEDPELDYWEDEYRYIRSNGEIAYVYDRGHVIYDEDKRPVRMVGAMRDITAIKLAQLEKDKITADLIEHNKNLEQFAYIVSHNLRAPVANIIGLAELLADEDTDKDSRDEMIDGLAACSKKLDTVITDLNAILQIKREISENKVLVQFPEVVQDIVTSISTLIDHTDAQIKYDFSKAGEIHTVKTYLHSIFYNLITNSIKYRKPAVKPIVHISSYMEKNKLMLLFNDNGMGIDLCSKKEQVFGLYKRFHPHIEGKGLGLFLTKTQVEALGGTIKIDSEINKGTTFTLEFPVVS